MPDNNYGMVNMIGGLIMTKKVKFRKIETELPSDAIITQISNIDDNTRYANFEVSVHLKKIQEMEDTMFALLDIHDKSDSMKALLVGDKSENFTSVLNGIKDGFTYRMCGMVTTINDDVDDVELPFIDEIRDKKILLIRALQYYPDPIFNSNAEVNELFGVPIEDLYDYNLKQAYDLVKEHTDYLDGILINDVRDIKFSLYGNVIILLNKGDVILDGKKVLANIKLLSFRNGYVILAISNDRIIHCLTCNNDGIAFITNNDYEYKKILVTPLSLIALTYENDIRFYGDLIDIVIDHSRFVNIEDIGYVEENNDIVVIKNGLPYSLLYEHDYSGKVPEVMVEGELDDVVII